MVIRATIIILCELKWKNNPRLIHSFLNIATAFIFFYIVNDLTYSSTASTFEIVASACTQFHPLVCHLFFNSCVCCVPLLYCFGGCYDEEDGCCWSSFSYVCVVRGDISHNVSFLRLAECFLTIFLFQYFLRIYVPALLQCCYGSCCRCCCCFLLLLLQFAVVVCWWCDPLRGRQSCFWHNMCLCIWT